jgi:hypothetical protein
LLYRNPDIRNQRTRIPLKHGCPFRVFGTYTISDNDKVASTGDIADNSDVEEDSDAEDFEPQRKTLRTDENSKSGSANTKSKIAKVIMSFYE